MRVDIQDIEKALAERRRINRADIMTIEFYDGAKPLKVSMKQRDLWRFTGLNIIDFIDLFLLQKAKSKKVK